MLSASSDSDLIIYRSDDDAHHLACDKGLADGYIGGITEPLLLGLGLVGALIFARDQRLSFLLFNLFDVDLQYV